MISNLLGVVEACRKNAFLTFNQKFLFGKFMQKMLAKRRHLNLLIG
jgi:hypothetical protein